MIFLWLKKSNAYLKRLMICTSDVFFSFSPFFKMKCTRMYSLQQGNTRVCVYKYILRVGAQFFNSLQLQRANLCCVRYK